MEIKYFKFNKIYVIEHQRISEFKTLHTSVFFHKFFHFFTSVFINRRKYWVRKNFRLPVFDGFTPLEMSCTRFDYFWKMFVCLCVCLYVDLCVCDKTFMTSVAPELMHRIS